LAKDDEVEERLADFVVRIISLCAYLPKTQAGKHLAEQLLHSSTASAARYVEAINANNEQGRADRLNDCLKELHITRMWLKIIAKGKLLTAIQLENITSETGELCRIISASLKTARNG